ncbi:hypothetical protein FM107_18845 [Sphingobacterium sp. JB170]|nr:hypothetical protein FM107_18845 [Sphingobacterium sp. JB170]
MFHPISPTIEDARKTAPGLIHVIQLENVGHWVQYEATTIVNNELIKFLNTIKSSKVFN